MASIIKVSVSITASPQRIWEELMNADNLKFWLTGFVSIQLLTGKMGETGSISKMKFIERGKEMELIETVLLSNPHQQYTSRMEHSSFEVENDIRLISFGNRTELIQTTSLRPKGFFMKLLSPLMKAESKKRTLNELMKLKNLIETN